MIVSVLPWMLSFGTIAVLWMAPTTPRVAWLLGIALQPAWILFAIMASAYGLLPLSVVLIYVYARNYRKALHANTST
jgi:hypothetical protein